MDNQIYVISDTHFGHEKMSDTWGIRPKDFNEKLWRGFDSLPETAILIHCGDVTLGADVATHERLLKYRFRKWLIRGNHDSHSIGWYCQHGWDMACDELVIKMYGENILFTHFPQPKRDGISKNIHGHLHGGDSRSYPTFYDKSFHSEVCPEVIGYTPAKLGY